jgi:hypothetical protein
MFKHRVRHVTRFSDKSPLLDFQSTRSGKNASSSWLSLRVRVMLGESREPIADSDL